MKCEIGSCESRVFGARRLCMEHSRAVAFLQADEMIGRANGDAKALRLDLALLLEIETNRLEDLDLLSKACVGLGWKADGRSMLEMDLEKAKSK